LVKALA